MNLHYSQTVMVQRVTPISFTTLWIYTILKQDKSQKGAALCFTTLWIYTILKQGAIICNMCSVSLPYEFTLFSNRPLVGKPNDLVSLPYEFTLFSNGLDGFVENR